MCMQLLPCMYQQVCRTRDNMLLDSGAVVMVMLLITQVDNARGESNAEFTDTLISRAGYDSRVRPGADSGKPVIVHLDMFINSISSIDEVNMDLSINIYFRQRWRDDRLTFTKYNETITLDHKVFDKLWVPDTFIRNEKKGFFHQITVPNRLIKLSPDGYLYYSQRLSLTVGCPMKLHYYPMDNQTCSIFIEPYGYTTKDLVLKLREESAMQLADDLRLPEYDITRLDMGDCTTALVTGSFSCQRMTLHLSRLFDYYLIQTYIPSVLVVALSWVSFWIDHQAVPARITLGLITVLTITTQSSGVSQRLPKVSYVKAIDVWLTTCLAFVVGALIEYSIVNVLSRRHVPPPAPIVPQYNGMGDDVTSPKGVVAVNNVHVQMDENTDGAPSELVKRKPSCCERWRKDKAQMVDVNNVHVQMDENTEGAPSELVKRKPSCCERWRKDKAQMVDVFSRFLFPLVFLVFNIAYWLKYKHVNETVLRPSSAVEL